MAGPDERRRRDDEPPIAHTHILHISALPGPNNVFTHHLARTNNVDQRDQAMNFYTFLMEDDPNFSRLNADDMSRVATIDVLKTKFVRLVYCIGIGENGLKTLRPYRTDFSCLPETVADPLDRLQIYHSQMTLQILTILLAS